MWVWVNLFTTPQILNRKFQKTSGFERKFVFGKSKLVGILAFKINFFVVFFQRKNLKLSIFTLFRKNWFRYRFEKNQFSNQFLYNASSLESRIFKEIRFRANFLRFVKLWIKVFRACQIFNQPLYHPTDFQSDFSERIRFWSEIVSTNQILFQTFL